MVIYFAASNYDYQYLPTVSFFALLFWKTENKFGATAEYPANHMQLFELFLEWAIQHLRGGGASQHKGPVIIYREEGHWCILIFTCTSFLAPFPQSAFCLS